MNSWLKKEREKMLKEVDNELEYHGSYSSGYLVFKCDNHHIDNNIVYVSSESDISMNDLLQAQMDFTMWFKSYCLDLQVLNGFRGTDTVHYDLSGVRFRDEV